MFLPNLYCYLSYASRWNQISPSTDPTSLTPGFGADVLTHLVLPSHHCVAFLTNCVVATLALPELLYASGCVTAVAPFNRLNPAALPVAIAVPLTTTLTEVD